ncbi:predicted protein, partial [Thalassiosira pseudonana CCMP1335]
YSHGHDVDLGLIYDFLVDLSRLLGVNIMSYDYGGYGLGRKADAILKKGKQPKQCYADIEACYNYLVYNKSVPPSCVILYGKSLGSGPTCWLAQKLCKRFESGRKKSVILHSAFLSVLRIMVNVGFTPIGDCFPNVDRVSDITSCPIYLIHGKEDEVIPFSHGKELYE